LYIDPTCYLILLKVDVDGVVERHLISRMKDGIAELQLLLDEWLLSGCIPEVDWERIRDLKFQEILRSRDVMIDQLSTRGCKLCPEFFDHASSLLYCKGSYEHLTARHHSWAKSSTCQYREPETGNIRSKFGAYT
jgi:hypothetical protein